MPLKCHVSASDIDKFLKRSAETMKEYILKALAKLGEECIVKIRNRGPSESWIDHTGKVRVRGWFRSWHKNTVMCSRWL